MAQALEVVLTARHWRMHDAGGTVTPEAYERARSWLQRAQHEGSYAVSIVMPFRLHDRDGLLCMSSTAESCSIDNTNKKYDGLRQMTQPGWTKYRCWFHAGLVMDNVQGMPSGTTAGVDLGLASNVFDEIFHARGVGTAWRKMYLPTPGLPYYQSLWSMFRDLEIKVWKVYTSGLSFREYAALDVYTRTYAFHVPEPEYEAHWLVNAEGPWYSRSPDVHPQDWYMFNIWESRGQTHVFDNWVLNSTSALAAMPSHL